MSENEALRWCAALRHVPARWRGEFCRFIEDGEASEDFLAYMEQNRACRRACEMVFRADNTMRRLIKGSVEQTDAEVPARVR